MTVKGEREFFDPRELPWRPAPGFPVGVWEQIIIGGEDEGVTTRFLRFDPGAGNDRAVTHDFWEEIYIVSGTFECGGPELRAGLGRGAPARNAPRPLPLGDGLPQLRGPLPRRLMAALPAWRSPSLPLRRGLHAGPRGARHHHVTRFGIAYMSDQIYLSPHSKELMLRNHT